MHIKTNIEHNVIQIIVLAICPLLLVINNVQQAIFFIVATSICFLASTFLCGMFNRYFSRNIKIFITAVLSSFIIAILDFFLKQEPKFGLQANSDCFYAVLATICLSLDVYYIDSKSIIKLHMFKSLIDCGIFAGILLAFSIIVEMFGSGSIMGIHLFSTTSGEFFTSITFKLILLGIITIIADKIYRVRQKKINDKKIIYEKYVRKIRDEKIFLYDELRRKKLLTSKVQINNVDKDFIDEINQKNAENQSIEEDIQDSLDKSETEQNVTNNQPKIKYKKSKSKLHVNIDRQEKEKQSAIKAAQRLKAEKAGEEVKEEIGKKSKKNKKNKKGKSKVERVYGSGSNSDKKN